MSAAVEPRPFGAEREPGLERAALDAVGRGLVEIPPYPAVAQRVNRAAGDADLGLDDVARIISADAALAADVLRCANSAFYRRGSAVTTLRLAVTRIGAREVMRIAMAASLGAYARGPGPLATVRRRIWVDNLAAAAVCQELARLRSGRAEEAFLAGLLHDFGKVVATAAVEATLQRPGAPHGRPADGWWELIERLHVPLGRMISTAWRLPPPIAEAIALHHEPRPSLAGDLLAKVRATDEVVHLLATSPGVTVEDLAALPGLSERERAPIARVVELLPELIAAFEAAAPAWPGGGERRTPATPAAGASDPGTLAPAPGSRELATPLAVTVGATRRARDYRMTAVTAKALRLKGDEPLPESRLVKVEVRSPRGPFSMWALVEECRAEAGTITAELRPFALSAHERGCWESLVGGAPPPTA